MFVGKERYLPETRLISARSVSLQPKKNFMVWYLWPVGTRTSEKFFLGTSLPTNRQRRASPDLEPRQLVKFSVATTKRSSVGAAWQEDGLTAGSPVVTLQEKNISHILASTASRQSGRERSVGYASSGRCTHALSTTRAYAFLIACLNMSRCLVRWPT